jgi:hypothetical protein
MAWRINVFFAGEKLGVQTFGFGRFYFIPQAYCRIPLVWHLLLCVARIHYSLFHNASLRITLADCSEYFLLACGNNFTPPHSKEHPTLTSVWNSQRRVQRKRSPHCTHANSSRQCCHTWSRAHVISCTSHRSRK